MASLLDRLVSANPTFWWHGGARNHRPDANHDSPAPVNENTGPIGENIGTDLDVLDNDTDQDNDQLDIIWVSDPRHGTTSIKHVVGQDPVINYVPDLNNEAEDWFFYIMTDGHGGYDLATVKVQINAARPAFPAADWYVG
jgi:Bacterial Ig domain